MPKRIDVQKPVLSANDEQALKNAQRLARLKLTTVNVMAGPGAGKTSVIVRLLGSLPKPLRCAVIEGDVAGSIDTDKIRALGFPATQINTDGGCHLDAEMIDTALTALDVKGPGFLFVENIGNLICPAGFNLGESVRLVIASVPEGHDKPVKYPGMFALADVVVLNKIDLLGYVDFEPKVFMAGLRAVNQKAPLFEVSCRTGAGVAELVKWLLARRA